MITKKTNTSTLYLHNRTLSYIRKTMLVSIALYAGFGILDYVQYPEQLQMLFTIRFLIVMPILFLIYFLTFSKLFKNYHQFLLLLLYIIAGSGIVFMIFFIQSVNYYYSGLFLVFAIGFYLLRLRWMYSTIAFATILSIFVIGGLGYDLLTLEEVFVHSFFYISFAIIGIFGGIINDGFEATQKQFEINSINTQ